MDLAIKAGRASLVGRLANPDAARAESGSQFGLEEAHAAGVGRALEDIKTKHEGIIP